MSRPSPRTAALGAVLLFAFGLGARAGDDEPDVAAAVRAAFAELGVEEGAVEVRDVAFWKAYASKLVQAGRMLEAAKPPAASDPLRPPLVDRMLRRPLEAVDLGLRLARGERPDAIRALIGPRETAASRAGEDPIPVSLQVRRAVRRLAARLAGLEDAVLEAFGDAPIPDRLRAWLVEGVPAAGIGDARKAFDVLGAVDLAPLRDLALDLVAEAGALKERSGGWPIRTPLRIETERGPVIVGSRKDDVHEEDAWLLVDPGGDDVYRNNAGGTAGKYRAALCIDLTGHDRYESEKPFVQGSAFGGVGILLDFVGNDRYRGTTYCQGAALAGIGLHTDVGGDDRYEAGEFAQGAAAFGVAALVDGHGNDVYEVDRLGQGLGRTDGVGLLLDKEGDDRYLARRTHKSMYSRWTGGRDVHWSWAQGCGFGIYGRFEETLPDGTKGLVIRDLFPGGVGALIDEAGNDAYEGSMYAQGTAYFYGLGILADLGGDDVYRATWYGQGAAPHFACGILVDAAGDDRYTGMHQVQGNGRDFSTAVFLDLEGDDVYVAEDRVQGCGDLRDAYGIFVDAAGDDRYDAKRRSARGWATAVKPDQQPTEAMPWADWGVFLDLGGADLYEGKASGADGTTWIQEATRRGVGIDR